MHVPMEERTLAFEGFAYHCRILHQDRPQTVPLVLLGGSSQNRFAWLRHEKWLTPQCTMVTVDLPGYGAADFLPARYGLDFLAANVRHMLTELGMPKVNLIGTCFGGAIALRFAQHYPSYLARLGLVGMTKVIPDDYVDAVPRWTRMLERGDRAQIATELVQRFMSPAGTGLVRKHEVVSRLLYAQFMRQSDEEIRMSVEHNARLLSHEWYRDEPVPAVPSLVFTGECDTLCPPAMGREVAASLPASSFTTIKEADHLAPVERMAEFADVIVRFCTDQPLTGLPYCNPIESLGAATQAGDGPPSPLRAPAHI
ncbi:alpha/beta hydrolase [Streptomyces sp. RB6PN25]|uniref:Alpha/beta hydrolase n=1 Tax=Streptomyces humicola TaxID=2953240 RepID=A0ABT1PRL2_9ACTN|nr:alpha/beta hydrolase [Streptomyces humicola]MCQ4080312.1 alpha/beta hydrolase [Streptomyces humicola]